MCGEIAQGEVVNTVEMFSMVGTRGWEKTDGPNNENIGEEFDLNKNSLDVSREEFPADL